MSHLENLDINLRRIMIKRSLAPKSLRNTARTMGRKKEGKQLNQIIKEKIPQIK